MTIGNVLSIVLGIAGVSGALMIQATYEKGIAQSRALPTCRAPQVDGEVTVITITVREKVLVFECAEATVRPTKKRKGG
jgi:hypothetical protein